MNNSLKNTKKKKLTQFIILIVILFLAILLAFFQFEKRANFNNEEDNTTTNEDSAKGFFASYEVLDDKIIRLLKDENSNYYFVLDKEIIFETKEDIKYFRIVNENSLVYLSSKLDKETNTVKDKASLLNLETKEITTIKEDTNLYLEVANGELYIIDGDNGDFSYGNLGNFKNSSVKQKISKVIYNKGSVFLINYSSIMDVIHSTVYRLSNGKSEEVLSKVEGKITSINVDFKNDNRIYYLLEKDNKSGQGYSKFVYSKFIKDLSVNLSGTSEYTHLNSNIISLKDKYISINIEDYSILLLNDNFTVNRTIGYINKNTLFSLIKESSSLDSIFYIDASGKITKL